MDENRVNISTIVFRKRCAPCLGRRKKRPSYPLFNSVSGGYLLGYKMVEEGRRYPCLLAENIPARSTHPQCDVWPLGEQA